MGLAPVTFETYGFTFGVQNTGGAGTIRQCYTYYIRFLGTERVTILFFSLII